jgi:hypothetical protein
MKRSLVLSLTLALLLMTADRLPAPIQEVQESPSPAPEQSAKPKPKRITESKTNHASTSSHAASTSAPARSKKFAGAWTGIMQTFPAGNQTTQIVINSAETIMTVSWFGQTNSAKAQLNGDSLQATFPPPPLQPQSHNWSITPQPDGVSASVHFQCFMNDFTAVFRRVGGSGAEKVAR